MACCVTKRPLVYYTFGDGQLRHELFVIHNYLSQNKVKIGEKYRIDSNKILDFIRIFTLILNV